MERRDVTGGIWFNACGITQLGGRYWRGTAARFLGSV